MLKFIRKIVTHFILTVTVIIISKLNNQRGEGELLPYIGALKDLGSGRWVAGHCSSTGFRIMRENLDVTSSGYKKEKEHVDPKRSRNIALKAVTFEAFLVVGLFCLLTFFSKTSVWFVGFWVLSFELCSLPAVLLMTVLLYFRENDMTRKYHGLEHKVCTLIAGGYDLTLENISKASKCHIACGTNFASLAAFAPIVLFTAFLVSRVRFNFVPQSGPFHEVLFWSPLALLLLSGFLGQYFFTVKEPTEEQLEEGLEVASRAKELLIAS